jgi:processing peptidase subunit alpha
MLDTLNTLGGNIMCSSTREALMYQAGVFHHHVPLAMKVLASTVNEPLFTEMDEVVDAIHYENEQMESKPETLMPELLHHVAWNRAALGNPMLCSADVLQGLNMDKIAQYHARMYVPSRLVVAGAGVEHDELVQLTQELFPQPASTHSPVTKSAYTGGHAMLEDNNQEFTHLHIGFRGVGIQSEDLYALATLQLLLGGGGSFSSGGPGKGMYSRIYTRVLNRHWWVEQCNAFNFVYSDDGLFGVASACRPEYAGRMVQVVCDELASGTVTCAESAQKFLDDESRVPHGTIGRHWTPGAGAGKQDIYGGNVGPHRCCGRTQTGQHCSANPHGWRKASVHCELWTTACFGKCGKGVEAVWVHTLRLC